jgi:hypothetical protein
MESINISQALKMELHDEIILYHTNGAYSLLNEYPQFPSWKSNFQELKTKYKKIPRGKLLDFISFDFIIEHKEELLNQEPQQLVWTYMYGNRHESALKLHHSTTKGQYVYVLTNEAYPGICKIGKAVSPISRVKQINGAGIVSEWQLRWALPVSDGYALENIVHQNLEVVRMDSFQGSSREFFQISLEKAIQTIENLGGMFKVSEGIYYEGM